MPSCAICSFEGPTDKDLKLHIQGKHDDRELTCQQCKKICKGGRNLNTHMNSHREVKCKQCDQTIPKNSTSSHMKKCVSRERDFKCENCPAVFKREDMLKLHVVKKRCQVRCNFCDKTCKSSYYLEKHISQTHRVQMNVVKTSEGHMGLFPTTEVRKDLKCTRCDFVATHPSKLSRHMITHDPKAIKEEEKCPKCEKTFKFKSHLDRHIPTSHRDHAKGNSRSNQYKKMKKFDVPKSQQFRTCTEKDLVAMLEKADVSTNQLLKLLSVLRKRFGRKAFEPNLKEKIRSHLNSLDDDFETNCVSFQSKDGKEFKSSLSKTRNVNHFLNKIAELRELQKPKVILGIDGDIRHLMITCVVKEQEEHDDSVSGKLDNNLKGTSAKRVLVLSKADGVPETRHNVELMLRAMKLHELDDDFQIVCDLKMLNILLGIQSSTSLFGCPFCEACKIDEHGRVTNQRGEWNFDPERTPLRTISNIVEHALAYENEPRKANGEKDKAKTKKHKSVNYKPIKLKDGHDDSWVGKHLPPDPLHVNVLGPPNDVFDLMEKVFSKEKVTEFYTRNNQKRSGEAAGGKFDGKSIKTLWSEKALGDLEENFPADIQPFIEFLRSIREVHDVCMKEELDLSAIYKEKIDMFETNRKYLYEEFGLNQTMKMHIIRDHYVTYFKMMGRTLREVSSEYHEAVHHTHKDHERKRGFYQKNRLGSASHIKRSQKSTVQFNVLHAGFAKSSDLVLRKAKKKVSVYDICSI